MIVASCKSISVNFYPQAADARGEEVKSGERKRERERKRRRHGYTCGDARAMHFAQNHLARVSRDYWLRLVPLLFRYSTCMRKNKREREIQERTRDFTTRLRRKLDKRYVFFDI